MSIKIRMTRLDSNHENLRTPFVEGYSYCPLEVGSEIMITAQPLDDNFDVRCIRTTKVKKIEGDLYYTSNSIYRIEVLT